MAASDIVFLPIENPNVPRKISVIVVPDFTKDGTTPENTQEWVSSMMRPNGTQAQIFRFEYRVTVMNHSVWRQLSEKGEDLLRIFRPRAVTYQIMEKPLVWVGYGLGGLIIKRAINILSDPALQPHGRDLLNLTAGVLFFGTPHTKTNRPEHWHRLTPLLGLAAKFPKRFIAQSEADVNVVVGICEDFEQSGLEATVLSVYETKPTKVKSSRWWLRDLVTLVDKAFAETWAKGEKLLGNDVSHEYVGTFYPRSPGIQQEIGLLLLSALSMRKHDMTASVIHGIDSAEQMDLWEDSISQISLDRRYADDAVSQVLTSGRQDSSEDANVGSSLPSNFHVVPYGDLGEYVEDEFESNRWPCHLWDGFEENRGFVGREDIFKAIDDCFFAPTEPGTTQSSDKFQEPPCCCISGLGGMGKTQTAIRYAMSRRDEFDAIFVVEADNAAKLSERFCRIAPALGLLDGADKRGKRHDEADLVVHRSKALKWLSTPKFSATALDQRNKATRKAITREATWLLIFDNVENTTALRDYWPFGSVGCILVTTRDARTSNLQSQVTQIDLDRLETEPASELFLQLSCTNHTVMNIKDASMIADKLGGLPLAIEQVAAYIYDKGMALKEFLNLYDTTLLDRRRSGVGSDSWTYEIAASWSLGNLSDPASLLLRVYSFLDPDHVQDSLLTDSRAEGHAQHCPQDYPETPLEHIEARGELMKSSLIRANMNTSPPAIRMHRLVQEIVLAKLSTSQRIEVFSFVSVVIFNSWPFTENSWDHQAVGWSIQEALLLHIFRLAEIATRYDISGLEVSIKRKFIELLSGGGWYRQERGDFDSGIPLFELGIQMCEVSPGDFLDLRADLSFGLGGATCDTNRWADFLVHAQDQLDFRLRSESATGGCPTSKTAIAYSELGLAQALMKQYEEGIKNCDRAIELYAKQPEVVDGSFFPAFPHIHRALALVGDGRPREGEQGLLELIRWHETRFGLKHTEFKLGYAWQCCGLIYARTGRPNQSIVAYNKALSNYQATVGPLYHRTGNVCGKIAEYHESLKQYDAADFFFNEALKAYTSQSHYKPELTRHHFIHAQALRDRGDDEAAKTALQKAQVLYDSIVTYRVAGSSMSLESVNDIVAPWAW